MNAVLFGFHVQRARAIARHHAQRHLQPIGVFGTRAFGPLLARRRFEALGKQRINIKFVLTRQQLFEQNRFGQRINPHQLRPNAPRTRHIIFHILGEAFEFADFVGIFGLASPPQIYRHGDLKTQRFVIEFGVAAPWNIADVVHMTADNWAVFGWISQFQGEAFGE